jgi:hypothetical protein
MRRAGESQLSVDRDASARRLDRAPIGGIGRPNVCRSTAGGRYVMVRLRPSLLAVVVTIVPIVSVMIELGRRW